MFGIALDEQKDGDVVEVLEGQPVVVEKELVDIYGGFSVDYSDSWFGKGFYVRARMGGSSC